MVVTALHSPLVAKWPRIYPGAPTLSWSSEFSFPLEGVALGELLAWVSGTKARSLLAGVLFHTSPRAGVEQSDLPHCAMCSPQDVSKHRA